MMRPHWKPRTGVLLQLLLGAAVLLLLAACQPRYPDISLTPIAVLGEATRTPAPSPTPLATLPPLPEPTPSPVYEEVTYVIYEDELSLDWKVENWRTIYTDDREFESEEQKDPYWLTVFSEGVDYDLTSDEYVFSGESAIKLIPSEDAAQFALTLRRGAEQRFPRENLDHITFWISGGDDFVELDELLLLVWGSQDYDYWVLGDNSAEFSPEDMIYSPTRLYFMELDQPIAPYTWQVADKDMFDGPEPDYDYVTALVFLIDKEVPTPLYIDQIEFHYLVPVQE